MVVVVRGDVVHRVKVRAIVRMGEMSGEHVRGEYIQGKCPDPGVARY